jgi:hypothetical protein
VACSHNFGQQRHKWIAGKKKVSNKKQEDIKSQLTRLFPQYKEDDIELLSTMITKKDLKQYAKDFGN